MNTATTTMTVTGMTCGHCVSSVREGVGEIDGVTSVDIDLAGGLVTIGSTASVERAAIAAAVDAAGYQPAD